MTAYGTNKLKPAASPSSWQPPNLCELWERRKRLGMAAEAMMVAFRGPAVVTHRYVSLRPAPSPPIGQHLHSTAATLANWGTLPKRTHNVHIPLRRHGTSLALLHSRHAHIVFPHRSLVNASAWSILLEDLCPTNTPTHASLVWMNLVNRPRWLCPLATKWRPRRSLAVTRAQRGVSTRRGSNTGHVTHDRSDVPHHVH